MPGPLQSVERAAAVLRVLGGAGRPLELAEIAAVLDLPKTTAFGLVRTLRDVGFVDQPPPGSAYTLGSGLTDLDRLGLDPHDLRSHATNWADALAAHVRLEVLVSMPQDDGVRVVHHVFRPDDTAQVLRVGESLPLHATATGKVVLATTASRGARPSVLERFTTRTVRTRAELEGELQKVRRQGWASALGEHQPGVGSVAVALRGLGGLAVGAVAVVGPVDKVFGPGGEARADVVREVRSTGRSISRALVAPW
ncbi:MAG: IclR family transcriptional regulator C-terminal domain-containing protein [Nocardioidaceae bacterium]|nr:IclR family transcriptional regulator C-terminal domain-containing protein [Nocardioidaceae bacterium]